MAGRRFHATIMVCVTDVDTGNIENCTTEQTGNMTLAELRDWVALVYPPLLKGIPELNAKMMASELAEEAAA